MSVHQMTRYVAIEMGIAARALTVWQEAGEELITLICVQQVFHAAQTSDARPSLPMLKSEVNGRIAWILFNILIVKVVWYSIWQPLLWDTVELCGRRLQKTSEQAVCMSDCKESVGPSLFHMYCSYTAERRAKIYFHAWLREAEKRALLSTSVEKT